MCPSSHHIFGHSLAEDLEEGLLPKVGQVLGGQAVTGQLPALRVLYGGVSLGPGGPLGFPLARAAVRLVETVSVETVSVGGLPARAISTREAWGGLLEVVVLLCQGRPPLPVLGHEHGVGGRVQLPGAPHI